MQWNGMEWNGTYVRTKCMYVYTHINSCIYQWNLTTRWTQYWKSTFLQPHWHRHLRIEIRCKPWDPLWQLHSRPHRANLLPKRRHVWRMHPGPLTHQVLGIWDFHARSVLTNGWESSTTLIGCAHTSLCCHKFCYMLLQNVQYTDAHAHYAELNMCTHIHTHTAHVNIPGLCNTWAAQPRPFSNRRRSVTIWGCP